MIVVMYSRSRGGRWLSSYFITRNDRENEISLFVGICVISMKPDVVDKHVYVFIGT